MKLRHVFVAAAIAALVGAHLLAAYSLLPGDWRWLAVGAVAAVIAKAAWWWHRRRYRAR